MITITIHIRLLLLSASQSLTVNFALGGDRDIHRCIAAPDAFGDFNPGPSKQRAVESRRADSTPLQTIPCSDRFRSKELLGLSRITFWLFYGSSPSYISRQIHAAYRKDCQ